MRRVSDRVMAVVLVFELKLICVYAPQSGSSLEDSLFMMSWMVSESSTLSNMHSVDDFIV